MGVRLVGLTGGIGSGKSSVSERLALRGAQILDADAVVRDLQQPGEPVFVAMVECWGDQIVQSDGSETPGALDRAAVAKIAFSDPVELKKLEAMVHPAVKAEIASRVDAARGSDATLIFDNPLLVKKGGSAKSDASEPKTKSDDAGWPKTSALIVVDCPTEVAVSRLMEFRNFAREDADKRIAAQATRDERLAVADFVIDNGGDLSSLDLQVEDCWTWLMGLPSSL